jgi:hypothetical protein
MKLDGSDEKQVSEFEAWNAYYRGKYIFAIDSSGQLYRIDPNSGEYHQMDQAINVNNGFDLSIDQMNQGSFDDDQVQMYGFNLVNDSVYYTSANDKAIHWMRDGVKGAYDVGDYDDCYIGCIAGDWLFFIISKTGNDQYSQDYYMLKVFDDQVKCVKYQSD